MCLIAFAWRHDPRWPLVVAANRDEFYARPTASADWSEDGSVLSGRDLRGGGTWMGVARDGRFAALTNHRDPASLRPDAPSRGALVDRALAGPGAAHALEAIAHDAERFNGFHLIAASWATDGEAPEDGWARARLSIVSHPGPARPLDVAPGIHGLSNAALDTPWPKVERATAALTRALARTTGTDALVEALFALLADDRTAPDEELPATGIPHAFERALSAAFIRTPEYGTRSSTALVVAADGRATFVERRVEPGAAPDERRFAFATATVSAARAS